MKEKMKCKKCGLLIDSDSKTCPYCGYDQSKEDEPIKTEEPKKQPEPLKMSRETTFILGSSAILGSLKFHLLLFFLGFFGLNIIRFTSELMIMAAAGQDFLLSSTGIMIDTSIGYVLTFGISILVIFFMYKFDVFKKMLGTNKLFFLAGFGAAIVLIGINIGYSYLIGLTGFNSGNENQQTIELVVKDYPVLSILVLGIIGPIVEEITYRLGLYSVLRRYNKILALIVVSVVFGLIHFGITTDMTANDFINELLNLPIYMISGFILSFTYDKWGFAASSIAHILNNLLSIIFIIAGI